MAHAADTSSDPSWVLTDAHILQVSQQLTDVGTLRTLGYRGLKLESPDIESAITNASNDIQTAAYKVLQEWMKQQEKREENYPKLVEALNECNMKSLTTKLKEWVESPSPETPMSEQRIKDIQRWIKQSFGSPPFCLVVSNDWTLKPKKIDIRKVYMDTCLHRRVVEAHGVEKKPLQDLSEMLREVEMGEEKPLRVLLQAESGMGKTTALKHLAVSWSDGSMNELAKFGFVFHISLKHVKDNSPIENIIIGQNSGLEANKVKPVEIKTILEGEANSDAKVLLLIDGHDEYKPGTNSDIDKAIEKKTLWNCRLILTSREREELSAIKEYMDAEFEIEGFNGNSIENYISRSCAHDDTKSDQLLSEAATKGLCLSDGKGGYIYDLSFLMIPLLLNMICSLFLSKMTLPRTKTGILDSVVNKIIDREAIRAKGQKALASANTALLQIGKLAWQGLTLGKYIFSKNEVQEALGEDVLDLGLLVGMEDPTEQEEEVVALCFPHISLQEFTAGKFVAQHSKDECDILFPSWDHILLYQEVVKFAVGLSKEPMNLIEFIYGKLIIHLRSHFLSRKDVIFLNSLGRELSTELSFNLFSNKYINYITKDNPEVYIPSKLYILNNNTPSCEAVKFPADHLVGPTNAECVLFVSASVLLDALSILGRIQEWLEVSLSVFGIHERIPSMAAQNFRFKDTETVLLKNMLRLNENTTYFSVGNHNLSHTALHHIALQLRGCVNLNALFFYNMQQFLPIKLGDAIATLKSLKIVNLEHSQMTLDSGRAIMRGLSQCEGLQGVCLKHCVLTDCLKDLLGGINHAGFPSLLELDLQFTKLCKSDVKAIADAAKNGQIILLKQLLLSGNCLANCLKILVPLESSHHPGFQSLQLLGINTSNLCQADILHLSQAVRLNKFPALYHLDAGSNCLTGLIGRLLQNPSCPGFFSLEGLNLSTAQLNKSDLKSLAQAMNSFKPGKLRSLHLIGNKLTGIVGELFTEAGLPYVGLLDLQETSLNKKDINSLSRAVQEGKLLHLRKLFLFGNNLSGMEAQIEHFLQTCTKHFRRSLIEVRISLNNLQTPEDFKKEISSLCQGTNVWVNWTQAKTSDDHITEVSFEGSFPLSSGTEPISIRLPSFEPQIGPQLYPFHS